MYDVIGCRKRFLFSCGIFEISTVRHWFARVAPKNGIVFIYGRLQVKLFLCKQLRLKKRTLVFLFTVLYFEKSVTVRKTYRNIFATEICYFNLYIHLIKFDPFKD